MRKLHLTGLVFMFAMWLPFIAASESLEVGFADPPLEARTRCFWWWLNGNVTKEAITRDMEEMQAKGFGGALIFDASSSAHRTVAKVPSGPMYGSPAWRELFRHTVEEANRLGLELGLNIQSGWNLGGPDITQEEAAKQLTWSEIQLEGPQNVSEALPAPNSREGYYRDVCVLAYKNAPNKTGANRPDHSASSEQATNPAANAADADTNTYWVSGGDKPGDGPTHKSPQWLQLTFQHPVTVSSVQVTGRSGYGPRVCQLATPDENDAWKQVLRFGVFDGKTATESFPAITAQTFRLEITGAYDTRFPDKPRNVQVSEWLLLDEAGNPVEGMCYGQPVSDLALKAAYHELGGSAPDCRFLLEDYPATPGEENAAASDIVNLTESIDKSGTLNWAVPEGSWTVMRFGYTLTDAEVSTASGDWQGPVLDYMSTPVLEAYWARHVQPLLDDIGPLAGKALRYLHTDSWECGGMNWTPGFEDAFRKQRGYDPLPYLPVIAGKIIESRDASNRFLADFRKTIAECVAENHYAHFTRMAHVRRLLVHPESGGPHAGPLDGIRNLGLSDMPMGEFWVPSPHRPKPENRFFVKQAASAAHIYGKQRVAAEAFTSIGPHWEDVLWQSVKPSFDHEACAGLNLSFIHTFTCSPKEMGIPGQEYFAGTHFNPQVTWWDMAAAAVVGYMNRCQFLLQQGNFVADVGYYYGDHIPNIGQRKEADPAGALPGYDYDVLDETSLLQISCDGANLLLPSGMVYRVLVLPDHKILSLPALQKIDQLVRAGATVSGAKPVRTASLAGSEEQFQLLSDELWGTSSEAQGKRTVGNGTVLWEVAAKDILKGAGVVADCAWDGDNDAFGFIHRRTDTADIYFVSNRSEAAAHSSFSFRITGKQPEFWDPLTGEIRDATDYAAAGDVTTIPIAFDPYGSVFVVFRKPWQAPAGTANFPKYDPVLELTGSWKVAFDPKWGGPAKTEFPALQSWTEHAEAGIRHYSGTATYTKTFDMPQATYKSDTTWLLDLGGVHEIASVRLNGKALGVLWTPPFQIEITEVLQEKDNLLEIDVVNNWPNRLIGDAGLPEAQRLTRTNVTKFSADMPLMPSGLLGPVFLLHAQ
jgi:hypothetical protein